MCYSYPIKNASRRAVRPTILLTFCLVCIILSVYNVEFASDGTRRGRLSTPKTIVKSAPTMVRNARERSLGVKGAQIFNLLPENIRGMNSEHVDLFKNHLDVFLGSIPDQPTVTGLGRGADSNSLLHQLPLFYSMTR